MHFNRVKLVTFGAVVLGIIVLVVAGWSIARKLQEERTTIAVGHALANALGSLKKQMAEDGHELYIPLVNEHELRDAIQIAITHAEKMERSTYFHDRVKPICQRIADEGVWPDNAEFSIISRPLKAVAARELDTFPAGKGFWLNLDINTPGQEHDGYSLRVVGVTYGR